MPIPNITAPTPALGQHGFVGYEGHIEESQSSWAAKTGFSLGVFQWALKTDGKTLKAGPVKVRIKGFYRDAANVYDKAREICAKLDAGEAVSQKSFSV